MVGFLDPYSLGIRARFRATFRSKTFPRVTRDWALENALFCFVIPISFVTDILNATRKMDTKFFWIVIRSGADIDFTDSTLYVSCRHPFVDLFPILKSHGTHNCVSFLSIAAFSRWFNGIPSAADQRHVGVERQRWQFPPRACRVQQERCHFQRGHHLRGRSFKSARGNMKIYVRPRTLPMRERANNHSWEDSVCLS